MLLISVSVMMPLWMLACRSYRGPYSLQGVVRRRRLLDIVLPIKGLYFSHAPLAFHFNLQCLFFLCGNFNSSWNEYCVRISNWPFFTVSSPFGNYKRIFSKKKLIFLTIVIFNKKGSYIRQAQVIYPCRSIQCEHCILGKVDLGA